MEQGTACASSHVQSYFGRRGSRKKPSTISQSLAVAEVSGGPNALRTFMRNFLLHRIFFNFYGGQIMIFLFQK